MELSLELKRKLIQEHEHGVPFTLLGKKYHIATSTAANIWRKKDFFLRSRMSGSRKRCNDRSKYKIVNQVTALFVKSMLERNHKIDGEVIKRFARTAAAQCNFKDFHGSNGWLDSFKKRENVCWVRRRGEKNLLSDGTTSSATAAATCRADSPNLGAAAAAAAMAATAQHQHDGHLHAAHQPAAPGADSLDCAGHWPSEVHEKHAEENCPDCTMAAAAAAIAALNSNDSIHERDHEIEDWFHGIPFLCHFIEEYQNMHHHHSPLLIHINKHTVGADQLDQQQQQQHQQHASATDGNGSSTSNSSASGHTEANNTATSPHEQTNHYHQQLDQHWLSSVTVDQAQDAPLIGSSDPNNLDQVVPLSPATHQSLEQVQFSAPLYSHQSYYAAQGDPLDSFQHISTGDEFTSGSSSPIAITHHRQALQGDLNQRHRDQHQHQHQHHHHHQHNHHQQQQVQSQSLNAHQPYLHQQLGHLSSQSNQLLPVMNGLEPVSGVILQDINLGSANWSSSEDLYGI